MMDRSLATYMNAWTASDWTMYPFATENAADYANLRDVYFDAVFHPRLAELDFLQEGWRLENTDNRSRASPWSIKGVVFNEMKGVVSDSESLFAMRQQQHMFPGSIYGNVSGGDPLHIPALSHPDLVAFHRAFYHPANALFFSYGSLDLPAHLQYLDAALATTAATAKPFVPLTDPMDGFVPFASPRRVSVECASDPMGDPARQAKVLLSFLANPAADSQAVFNMKILASLLLDGPAAPMHKALIDSNMGSEYAPGTGYDASTALTSVSVGLQGIRSADVGAVERIVFETVRAARQDGFAAERVEAVLHQIELGLRYHSASFGLGLAQRATSSWVYGMCPLDEIAAGKKVRSFREAYRRGGLFESIIDRVFLANPHVLTFVAEPSADFFSQQVAEEKALVAKLCAAIPEGEREAIFQRNLLLQDAQESPGNKDILPCLQAKDICAEAKKTPFAIERGTTTTATAATAIPTLFHRTSPLANGLAFFHGKLALPRLPEHELALLPLMASCIGELGTGSTPADVFDEQIKLATGGLGVGVLAARPHGGAPEKGPSLLLSSHALAQNAPRMLELLAQALTDTNWSDVSRLRSVLAGSASSAMNSIASSGHSFATTLAAAGISAPFRAREILSGLTQAALLDRLSSAEDLAGLSEALGRLARSAIAHGTLDASYAWISDGGAPARPEACIMPFHAKISSRPAAPQDGPEDCGVRFDGGVAAGHAKSAIVLPFSTNFVAKVFQADPRDPAQCANLTILSRILRSKYLHREIREKNGAYGGGASFSPLDGLFSFYSYRDPNPLRSLEAIDGAGTWFVENTLAEQDLLEAKLAVFSSLDAPVDLAAEGLQQFKHGITDAERQEMRDELFLVTGASLRRTAERHLIGAAAETHASVVLAEDREDVLAGLSARGFAISRDTRGLLAGKQLPRRVNKAC